MSTTANDIARPTPPITWTVRLAGPVVLAALAVAVFADALWPASGLLIGHGLADLRLQFLAWRQFGFDELARGNLVLWNPHNFCGSPFHASMQSALLYPPNWLHLVLPLAAAINLGIVLHLYLAGLFTYLWCRGRDTSRPAATLAGAGYMFCAPYFLHTYAGHLPYLCVAAWTPLLLLTVDRIFDNRNAWWWLAGMAIVAMQILAGFPQPVYYTGLVVVLYSMLRVAADRRAWPALVGLAAIHAGGALLAAAQLLPAIDLAGQSVRAGGVTAEFAAQYSVPPENLLTLLSPRIFGDMSAVPYFGRWYLWEVCLFTGLTTLVLAVLGAVYGQRRQKRWAALLALACLVLAMGSHTPLFAFLRDWLPLFGSFRVAGRFGFLFCLFTCLLAAIGFDHLARAARSQPAAAAVSLAAGICLALGLFLRSDCSDSDGFWAMLLDIIARSEDSMLPRTSDYYDAAFIARSGAYASAQLLLACGILAAIGLVLLLLHRRPRLRYSLLALSIGEVFVMAALMRDTFAAPDLPARYPPAWRQAVASAPPGSRVFHSSVLWSNAAPVLGFDDIWGYDVLLRRYAQFMALTQGLDPDQANYMLPITRPSPLFRLLRCGLAFTGTDNITPLPDPLPRLLLVSQYAVLSDRNAIFAAMAMPTFDPARHVVLESPPDPLPRGPVRASASVVRCGTDDLEIVAELDAPAILVITDAYATGWRVRSIAPTGADYRVVPANYALRAIALPAGRHHFILEYSPTLWRVGRAVSLVSLSIYMVIVAGRLYWKRRNRHCP